jgi:hypothetical protein
MWFALFCAGRVTKFLTRRSSAPALALDKSLATPNGKNRRAGCRDFQGKLDASRTVTNDVILALNADNP